MSDITVIAYTDPAVWTGLRLWRSNLSSISGPLAPQSGVDLNATVIVFNDPASRNITSRNLYYQRTPTDFGAPVVRGMERYFLSTFKPPVYKSFKYNYQSCDFNGSLSTQIDPGPHKDPWLNKNRIPKYNFNSYLYYQGISDSGSIIPPPPILNNIFVVVFNSPAAGATFRYNSTNFDIAFDEVNDHEPPRFTPTAYSIMQKMWQNEAQEDSNTAPPPAVAETNTHFIGKFTGPSLCNWRFNYNNMEVVESFPPLAEPHFIGKFTPPWKINNLQFQYNLLTGDFNTPIVTPTTNVTTVNLTDISLTALILTDNLTIPTFVTLNDIVITSISLSNFPLEE